MADNQNQYNTGWWGDIGRGVGVEAVSTLAEQGAMFLGGAGVAYGVSQAARKFSPGLATKYGVASNVLLGGFKAGHGSVKGAALNYGLQLGTAAIGGVGLHMLRSNQPHNKINSNEPAQALGMSAAGGAIMGGAFIGAPMAAGLKEGPHILGNIAASNSVSNYLDKRVSQIHASNLSDSEKASEIKRVRRYRDMQDRVRNAANETDKATASINVAKEARRGIIGDKMNGMLEKSTDKLASKLYHMKGRSAAVLGGSMLLGAAVGAGMYGANSAREG